MKTENVNKDKVLGYILLVIGLIMIVYAFLSAYNVFTGQKEAITLFTLNGIAIDLSQLIEGAPPPGADLTQTLVEPELINRPLNLIAHLFFMGFVSSIGYKITRVGTLLIRTVKVQVRQEKEGINITAK